jgi:tetratricopeptide (TPR) repeat protein
MFALGRRAGAIVVLASVGFMHASPALAEKAGADVQAAADACFGKTRAEWQALVAACSTVIATNVRPDLKAAAHFNRGAAYLKQGEGEKALPDFDAALVIMPDFARALEARGGLLFTQGKIDQALKDLDRAIVLDPKSAVAFNNRALVRLQKKDAAGAIADFERSLALDATDAAVFAARGSAHATLGARDKALADFNRALELDGKLVVALGSRGALLAEAGDTAGAQRDFDAALKIDPGNGAIRRQLAALTGTGEGQ